MSDVDIFLGKITSWNDARIRAANPQVSLPSKPITVIVRTDSSGTTFAFTNHLAAVNKEWRDGPGVGKAVQWPCRYIGATGNEGVAGQIAHPRQRSDIANLELRNVPVFPWLAWRIKRERS